MFLARIWMLEKTSRLMKDEYQKGLLVRQIKKAILGYYELHRHFNSKDASKCMGFDIYNTSSVNEWFMATEALTNGHL